MGGCFRALLRILGSLAIVLALLCFGSWNRNLQLEEAATRQGDEELAAGFADNAMAASQAGFVFGGTSVSLWVVSFFIRRRSGTVTQTQAAGTSREEHRGANWSPGR